MALGDRTPKKLAQAFLTTTLAGVYTVPASTRTQVTQMWLANTDTQNDKDVRLADGTGANNVIAPKITVPKASTVAVDGSKIVMSAAGVFAAKESLQTTGTAQAGAASTITLAAGASATNDFYTNQVITITAGVGAGQSRNITAYVGATKVATVDTNWGVNPNATSVYSVGDVIITIFGIEEGV